MNGFHGKNIMNGKRTGKHMKTKPSGQFNPSINRLLSFILSILILLTVAAPFAEPQTVEANWVTRTIGALITSLALQSGAANIDSNYLNYVNDPNNTVMQIEIPNDGGVTSLPADLASQIDTALQSAPAEVQRTVGGMETTQAEVINLQNYLQNNGVASSDVPNLQPATVGENIASSARQLQQTGEVQPSISGQAVGAFAGMVPTVWNYMSSHRQSTLQKGEIIQACIDGEITQQQMEDYLNGTNNWLEYKNVTASIGEDIGVDANILQHVIPGGHSASWHTIGSGSYYTYLYVPSDCIIYEDSTSSRTRVYVYNKGNSSVTCNQVYYFISDGRTTLANINVNANASTQVLSTTSRSNYFVDPKGVYSKQDKIDYENNVFNYEDSKSPSLVGSNGQYTANVNVDPTLNINYYTTNEAPTYNYNNYSMEPVDLSEYTQFAQSIQQQIASQTPQAQISEAVEQYVNQHLIAAPIPTAAPVVPDQPVPDPKPTGTPEQVEESQEIMATPELKDKFPFCIPWDVYYAFAVLEDQREAPSFDFELDLGAAGSHHVEIDFSEWEDIASLLRLLELLAFIIGLAIATKHLMGGTGA